MSMHILGFINVFLMILHKLIQALMKSFLLDFITDKKLVSHSSVQMMKEKTQHFHQLSFSFIFFSKMETFISIHVNFQHKIWCRCAKSKLNEFMWVFCIKKQNRAAKDYAFGGWVLNYVETSPEWNVF